MLTALSFSRTGQVAAIRSTTTQPAVLVTFAVSKLAEMRTLVDVDADVLQGVTLSPAEELWYASSDGLKIQGWLMKPANFDPARKYPMVLWIHGGPWSMYNAGWNWAFQNWAANGYAVLWTNPRGSTGYGQAFVDGIQFSYPGKDYDDLMAGVDAALAKGWIDKDNLFVCGGSGGGLLTAWIVGHTNRFRAAVSMRPVIDWQSFVGITDGASWYRQFQKYPWEDPMEYAVRSPLHYVASVTTPTMVMTGADGHLLACCSVNITEVYAGLREGEELRTTQLLESLQFYPVTFPVARLAGLLKREYGRQGITLAIGDVTVAAVALLNHLTLITDNRKHYPMKELSLYPLP